MKLFIVVDCKIIDPTWTADTVRENVPDYVGTLCGPNPSAIDGPMTAYILDDPTVYTSLADFDADRHDKLDHFAEDKPV